MSHDTCRANTFIAKCQQMDAAALHADWLSQCV